MSVVLTEGDLEFTFDGKVRAEQLDGPAYPKPSDMKSADFLVEEDTRIVLIEVKDPSARGVPAKHRASVTEAEETKRAGTSPGNDLVADLVLKARHSYTYLHLMEQDTKPCLFVFVDDTSALGMDKALLVSLKDRLLKRLVEEPPAGPWARQYVTDCVVVDPATGLVSHLPGCSVRRLSP